MFESLDVQKSSRRRSRWIGFVAISGLVNVALVAGAAILISQQGQPPEEEAIPIAFAAPRPVPATTPAAVSPVSPPPPAPRPGAGPLAPRSGKRLRKALEAPARVPDAPPLEMDPVRPPGSDEASGTGLGVPGSDAGSSAPIAALAVPPPKKRSPRTVTEVASPPVPVPGNPEPVYPEAARTSGIQGEVDFKVEVTDSGQVIPIRPLRGEEPFLTAVHEAIANWRFRPAMNDGQAVAVYRVLRFRFRLQD